MSHKPSKLSPVKQWLTGQPLPVLIISIAIAALSIFTIHGFLATLLALGALGMAAWLPLDKRWRMGALAVLILIFTLGLSLAKGNDNLFIDRKSVV